MQVDVPITLTMSSVRQPAPMASQWGSKAPTGDGNACFQSQLLGPMRGELSRNYVSDVAYSPSNFSRTPFNSGMDFDEKFFRGQPAQRAIPHPLVAHGADAALHFFRFRDAAERSRNHVAMLERGSKVRALLRIVTQPVQQLGKIPTPRNRLHRTTGWLPNFSRCAIAVIWAASPLARWSHHR